jgi:hypothetical protein
MFSLKLAKSPVALMSHLALPSAERLHSPVTDEQAFRLVPGVTLIPRMTKKKTAPATTLKGWTAIAKFLVHQPGVSTDMDKARNACET